MTRILVVDDEAGIRATVAANLELAGFEVVEAEDARRAIETLERDARFDLLLSDIRMPGMSGVELFQHVKKTRPDLPVILMTAFALENQIAEAIASGVFTVLTKPFEVDAAVSTLRRASEKPLVLVVDGSERTSAAIAASLATAGLRARGLSDVGAAAELVRGGAVDVCVVDNGTAQAIRSAAPAVVLVVVSETVSPEVMAKVAHAAPFAFLKKPVASAELIATIAKARARVT